MNELKDKLARYLGFLAADPSNMSLLRDSADLALQINEVDQALGLITRGLDLDPTHPGINYLLATANIQNQKFEEAYTILHKLLGTGIDNPGIRYNLGLSALYIGRFAEVDATLTTLINETPDAVPHAKVLLARAKHHLGELDEAADLLHEFLTNVDDEHVEANGLLALLYQDRGDNERALAYAKKTLLKNANNHEALITLATVTLDNLDLESALQQFENILHMNDNSGRSWLGKGLVELYKNNSIGAEGSLKRCVELMPSHLGSWNALAWAQVVQNKLAEAEQTLLTALETDRNFGDTHGGLACVQLMLGRIEEAAMSQRRAERLDATSFAAQFAKALLLQHADKPDLSQQEMQELFNRPIVAGCSNLLENLQKLANGRSHRNFH